MLRQRPAARRARPHALDMPPCQPQALPHCPRHQPRTIIAAGPLVDSGWRLGLCAQIGCCTDSVIQWSTVNCDALGP